MVIVEPGGGLCNRLRTVNSAYFLSRKLGQELTVLWKLNKELNCPYEQLFQPSQEFEVINFKASFNIKRKHLIRTSDTQLYPEDIMSNTDHGKYMLRDDYISTFGKQIYMRIFQQFLDHPDYHIFVPTKEIQKRIDAITCKYGEHCVGVHIRRTDSVKSIETSSTDGFVVEMHRAVEQDPDTVFYLATDDKSEEKRIRKHFPDRILTLDNKTLDRNSADGIKDALVDFMCLASTKRLIGSYWSSFTDMAADFYKIPVTIVGGEKAGD